MVAVSWVVHSFTRGLKNIFSRHVSSLCLVAVELHLVTRNGGIDSISFFGSHLASVVDVSLMLFLLKLIFLVKLLKGGLSMCIGRGVSFSVILGSGRGRTSVGGVRGALSTLPCVGSARCVSGRRTIGRLRRRLKRGPRAFLNFGPLRTSVRIGLRSRCTGTSDLRLVRGGVGGCASISSLLCQGSVVRVIGSGIGHIDLVLLALTMVLVTVSFILVDGAVHLLVCSGHFLVRAVGLIKTAPNFVEEPFIQCGIIDNVFTSVFTVLVLAKTLCCLRGRLSNFIRLLSVGMLVVICTNMLVVKVLLSIATAIFTIGGCLQVNISGLCCVWVCNWREFYF